MTNIRVAIVGSFSTGKSTLSQNLSDELKIPISGHYIEKNLDKSSSDLSFFESIALVLKSRKQRVKFEKNNPSFVSDSGTLSEFAYCLAFGKKKFKLPYFLTSFVLKRLKLNHAKKYYDKIIYLPPEANLESNGFRPKDNELRLKADECLRNILNKYDFNFITIKGTEKERLISVLKFLD